MTMSRNILPLMAAVVVDANNRVEQAHDYTVSGVPATRLGQTVDHHLHTGKPWQGFNGLGWYDNRARMLDALTGRFTTPDPLAEKYPWESPYAHCANNPVNNIDPTGEEIVFGVNPTSDKAKELRNFAYNHYRDDNAINIFAHGQKKQFTVYDYKKGEDIKINNSVVLNSYLQNNSQIWQNRKEEEKVTIVLHCCETGKGENSIAEQLSSELENVKVIAPSDYDSVTKGNKEYVKNGGVWRIFENGNETGTSPGNQHPNKGSFEKVIDFIYNLFY